MMNLAAADASINCWNDKYDWDVWRPWQPIREADRDGNPATEPDPSWTALITAPYPTTHPGIYASTVHACTTAPPTCRRRYWAGKSSYMNKYYFQPLD